MFPESLKPVEPLPAGLSEPPTPIVQKGHQSSHAAVGASNNSSITSMGMSRVGSEVTLGASFRKGQSSPPTKNSSSHQLNMLAENSGSDNGMSGKSVSAEGSSLSLPAAEGGKKKKRKVQIGGQGLDDLELGAGFVLDEEEASLADSAGRLTPCPVDTYRHAPPF